MDEFRQQPDWSAVVEQAADRQWNKALPEVLNKAIAECEKINQSLIQLLDQVPVTRAMQFAVAYGWMLRARSAESALIT